MKYIIFLAKVCKHSHTSIWNNGCEFGNDIIYIYDFIKLDTLLASECIYITRYDLLSSCVV